MHENLSFNPDVENEREAPGSVDSMTRPAYQKEEAP
jgi:hypothetical protein